MSDNQHPFQPGVKVALITRFGGKAIGVREGTVAKLHKNGNFVLIGESKQWRPYSYKDGAWAADRASSDPWDRERLELMTDELREQREALARRAAFLDAVKDLSRVEKAVSQSHVAAITVLRDELIGP